jgi:hypothetical protein
MGEEESDTDVADEFGCTTIMGMMTAFEDDAAFGGL